MQSSDGVGWRGRLVFYALHRIACESIDFLVLLGRSVAYVCVCIVAFISRNVGLFLVYGSYAMFAY
jgi:hypothetical protein